MADADQTYSALITADLEKCLDVLLDFERYPEWSSPILETTVEERDEEGRGRRVSFALDMRIRTIRYTLAYEYDLPGRLSWTLVDGDVSGVQGDYSLEAAGEGCVRATCHQAIDIGFWVPGPIRRIAERQALRDSVEEFRAEAERRQMQG